MGKHLCEICKKEFKKKCNLISHQNRKYPCKLREYNEKGDLCIVNSENLIYKCAICSSTFSNKSNLNRHMKKCEKKYNKITGNLDINKELNSLKEYIKEYMGNKKDNNVTYNTNITLNANIMINNFGDEKIDHINGNFLSNLFNMPEESVPKLIKEIHFSDKNKVNKNIYLTNDKEGKLKVFYKNRWVECNRDKTLSDLICKNFDRIDDYYEINKNKIDKFKKVKYERYADDFDSGKNREKINDDVCKILVDEGKKINESVG